MSENQKNVKIQMTPTFMCNVVAVQKRSGGTVPFDAKKIFEAIKKAVSVTGEISDEQIVEITGNILSDLDKSIAYIISLG